MAVPDATVLEVLKDWLWAPALALVGWAWKRNEKEHDDMRAAIGKTEANVQTLGSHLNDKLMDHIDDQIKDTKAFVMTEDAKLMNELGVQRGHIGKIFGKMEEMGKRNEDRHAESLRINNERHLQILERISDLSTAMHQALAHKVDK